MLDGLLNRGFSSKWYVLSPTFRSLFENMHLLSKFETMEYMPNLCCIIYAFQYFVGRNNFWLFTDGNFIYLLPSKSLIKATRTRIEVLRRRAEAKQRFLKEDLAKLLANGLDINAFGRVILLSLLLF